MYQEVGNADEQAYQNSIERNYLERFKDLSDVYVSQEKQESTKELK